MEAIFHPCWHRDGAGMPRLSFQIDNRPVFPTLLNMAEIQINFLMLTNATCEQYSQKRSITFFLQTLPFGSCYRACDCSAASHFPVYADFLNPFTVRNPAAKSGLRSPQSPAS
jgi:hypothetical protein